MNEANVDITIPPWRFWSYVAAFYAAWCLRVVLLLPVDNLLQLGWLRQCWSQTLRVALWMLPLWLYLKYVEGIPPACYLRLNTPLRRVRLVFGVSLVLLIGTGLGACLLQGKRLQSFLNLSGSEWAGVVVGMTLVAFAEEMLFRGFIFRNLRDRHSFLCANLVTAILFLAIHWPGWLYMQGFHGGLLALSGSILLIGFVLGGLVEVSGSLWPAVLLHLANNVLSAGFSHG